MHVIEDTQTHGWYIGLSDTDTDDYPIAVHPDTGAIYALECIERGDDDWGRDWTCTTLDGHWGDTAALMRELHRLIDAGRVRVYGAVHGLPGSGPLGAIF